MEWSTDNVLEFLECYEKEPVIWQASHGSHKNRNEIFDAWRRIEIKLGKRYSVVELKKKDSLMACFRTCHNKVKQSLKSGAGANEIYKPNWFAYEKMLSFLKDKDQPKETLNSEEILSEEDIENHGIETEGLVKNTPEKNSSTNEDVDNSAIILPLTSNSAFKVPSRKRKNISEPDNLTNKLNDAYSVLQATVQKNIKEKDIYDMYGELLVAKLRNLDEDCREIAMRRMDNILFEMRKHQSMPPSNQHQQDYQENLSISISPYSQESSSSSSHLPSQYQSSSSSHVETCLPSVSDPECSHDETNTGLLQQYFENYT